MTTTRLHPTLEPLYATYYLDFYHNENKTTVNWNRTPDLVVGLPGVTTLSQNIQTDR